MSTPTLHVGLHETIAYVATHKEWAQLTAPSTGQIRDYLWYIKAIEQSEGVPSSLAAAERYWKRRGERAFVYSDHCYVARPRPGAEQFLSRLADRGVVRVLSGRRQDFIERVGAELGLLRFVHDIFGKEQYGRVPFSPRALVIDNAPRFSNKAAEKRRAAGVADAAYVEVPPWDGVSLDDRVLLDNALPAAYALLAQQSL